MPDFVTAEAMAEQIKAAVAGCGSAVRQRVVDTLVEEEVGRRAGLLVAGLAKREEAVRKAAAIRPDVVVYGADGKPVGEPAYSKARIDEKRKADEAVAKLDKAIAAALAEPGDFEPLKKAAEEKAADKGPGKPAGGGDAA